MTELLIYIARPGENGWHDGGIMSVRGEEARLHKFGELLSRGKVDPHPSNGPPIRLKRRQRLLAKWRQISKEGGRKPRKRDLEDWWAEASKIGVRKEHFSRYPFSRQTRNSFLVVPFIDLLPPTLLASWQGKDAPFFFDWRALVSRKSVIVETAGPTADWDDTRGRVATEKDVLAFKQTKVLPITTPVPFVEARV